MARRDIKVEALWRVGWRKGDGDAPWQTRDFDDEVAAQMFVADLLQPNPKDWRDLTDRPSSAGSTPGRG